MQAKILAAALVACLAVPLLIAPRPAWAGPQGKVLVINTDSDTVTLIDARKPEVVMDIRVGDRPTKLAMNVKQTMAYVINIGSNDLSIIDLRNLTVLDVPLGFEPVDVAATPDGKMVLILHKDRSLAPGGKDFEGDYSIYDVKKGELATNYLYGSGGGADPDACAMAVDATGKFAWITSCADDTVVMIELKKALDDNSGDEVKAILDTQDDPSFVAVTAK
ncbi:MAG: hypothetical protein Q8R92_01855 [Deltaproteobacteria bacterium]|nr:hypothetical protein [Deltaproteobacteria bacterium]